MKKIIGGIVGGILLIIVLLVGFCGRTEPQPTPIRPTQQVAPAPIEMVEALVPEDECLTPCSVTITYRARIRWGERRPLRIKFPGVDQPVEFPGEGAFKAPTEADVGEYEFVSADPENLHFRVEVFRKVLVPKP